MKKFHLTHHQENKTLRTILDSLAEGVVVADKDGKFLFTNPVAKKLVGVGQKDVNPTEWASAYGTYYSDGITPYPSQHLPLARAIKGEEVANEIIFIKNPEQPDGLYINVSASPLKDAEDSVKGGTIIIRDITDSKLAEMELKKSEERLKAVFKGFPIPSYIWQRIEDDFILIDHNDAADVFTNGLIKKLVGIRFSKMYEKSPYQNDIKTDFLKCVNEKTTVLREMSYQLRSIDEIKELKVCYVFVSPDLILVHTEDITDNKIAEVELRKLSNAVEQTADSVVITNKRGVIEYVNPAFVETTGFSREEALGQTPRILKSGDHDKAFYKKLWKTVISGNTYRGTIINKKKNDERYWSQQTITPMKNKNGEITNFVSV
ncbi:MAG: PAS domain S-box protein, partial [Ignavibacteriaceae bacterium]|nr:PAS domain S-box protein [Ignavibacteriaceae bacterium]